MKKNDTKILSIIILIILITTEHIIDGRTNYMQRKRKKRMIVVPKGTVIQLVYCYLMSALGTDGVFTVGVTLGLNWDVPENVLALYDDEVYKGTSRKDRRSFYSAFRNTLESLQYDSISYIRSMLCYTKDRVSENHAGKASFIVEIIRTLFLYPSASRDTNEPNDIYDWMLEECNNTDAYYNEINSLMSWHYPID